MVVLRPLLPLLLPLLTTPTCLAGSFWHISDLHLDWRYAAGGDRSAFCHAAADGSVDASVGPAGDYSCDAPFALVMSGLEAMAAIQSTPDFIVWTGDSAPHTRDPEPDLKEIANVTKLVFQQLDKLFPNVPIVAALGNHDASPPDMFPMPENKTAEYYVSLWRQGAFGDHIAEEGRETFQLCGYYTKVVALATSSVRFIVLNTNIYYGDEYTLGADPCGQLQWLNDTLAAATEPVYVVTHVPPGGFERGHYGDDMKINFNRPNDTYHEINKVLVQLLSDPGNAAKIQGQLYGHLHTDTFRLLLDRATGREARGVAFMAGSVTPVVWGADGDNKTGVVGVNPSVRLFTFDSGSMGLLDYSEYSLDIVEANKGAVSGRSRKKELDEGGSRTRREVAVEEAATEAEGAANDATTPATTPKLGSPQTTEAPGKDELSTEELPNPTTAATTPLVATSLNDTVTTETPETKEVGLDSTDPANAKISDLAAKWKLLYKATSAFNVTDLSPSSMLGAVRRMVAEGAKGRTFQAYYRHNTAGHLRPACGDACWRDHLCVITRLVEAELNTCIHANGTQEFTFYTPEQQEEETTTTMANDNDNLTLPPDLIINASTGPHHDDDQPKIEPMAEDNDTIATNAVSIFFGIVGLVLVMLVAGLGYKRWRDNRYRNQEFLLTDSVFRYDGYSQLDDD